MHIVTPLCASGPPGSTSRSRILLFLVLAAAVLWLGACENSDVRTRLEGATGSSSTPPPATILPSFTPLGPPKAGKVSAAGCTGTADPVAVNDPLYAFQWHLKNTGQVSFNDPSAPAHAGDDIHQTGASPATGCGIKVAAVDTGLELMHEDLAPNLVPGASANFNTGLNDPTPTASEGDHGTSVAGLAGARINNGLGGRGVAGEASLAGYNFLASTQSLAYQLAALGGAAYSADVDVFNQSYGCVLCGFDPAVEAQLLSGATSLRGGKGAVYVKSAGNGYGGGCIANCGTASEVDLDCSRALAAGISCQDANMDEENTLPFQVIVGALNAGLGTQSAGRASYSTAGSALWVSAPGGEFGGNNATITCGGAACGGVAIQPALVTTDLTGCTRGYAVNTFNGTSTLNAFNLGAAPNGGCNYTSTFNGTSSAAPIVAGAVAVLLSTNPALTWRDVKYLLARTAVQIRPGLSAVTVTCGGTITAVPAWITNGAGFHHQPEYGFGRIDLDAAVALAASNWTPNGFGTGTASNSLTDTGWFPATPSSAGTGAIPDCNASGRTTATLTPVPAVSFIEAVRVHACFTHANAGDLQFELNLGGSGTSVILPGRNGLNGFNVSPSGCMDFAANSFYGLASAGGFSLTAIDTLAGNAGSLDAWQVRVYGH